MIHSNHQIMLQTLTIVHKEVLQGYTRLYCGGAKVSTHLPATFGGMYSIFSLVWIFIYIY